MASPLLIDVSRLVGRLLKGRLPTGIDRVGLAYVRHYGHRARAVIGTSGSFFVCRARQSEAVFDWLLRSGRGGTSWQSIWRTMLSVAPAGAQPGSIFLNTGHTNLDRPRYIRMLRRREVRPLFLVHDLIPISHPQFCRAGEHLRHEARIRNAIASGSGVICNSRATFEALKNYGERIALTLPPSVVAPLAPDTVQEMVRIEFDTYDMTRPYFLMLSTIEPRKNHLMILQVWQRLVEQMGDRAPRLVIVGQRGWECESIVRILERSERLRPFVIEKSRCEDQALTALLQNAQALLFPSFAEGFGMPVIEALSQGVPVIASDLPVFREFAGDIPEYVDPLDVMRWMHLIMAYAYGSPQRSAQIVRMNQLRIPTWAEHFDKVDELIGRVVHGEMAHA